jgi:hypothetical protein
MTTTEIPSPTTSAPTISALEAAAAAVPKTQHRKASQQRKTQAGRYLAREHRNCREHQNGRCEYRRYACHICRA